MATIPEYPFDQNSWMQSDHVCVIGHAFGPENEWLEGKALAARFASVRNEQAFVDELVALNGSFAVFIDCADYQAAAVDRIRSFPIIYGFDESGLHIVQPDEVREFSIDPEMESCFISSWCTPGNYTLHPDFRQLMAGQYIWLDGESSQVKPEYYYYHFKSSKWEGDDLMDKLKLTFDQVMDRCIRALDGKHVLIPLSGGYDSRLLMAALVKRGYSSISAYTYGRAGSHEVETARKVAQTCGVEWYHVEYDEEVLQDILGDAFREYSSGNHHYTSLPHEQDFFALMQLKDQLPKDFIALPGFCGDLHGGSITAYKPGRFDAGGLEDFIRIRHFHGSDLPIALEIIDNVEDESSFYDQYQQYFVTNKASKFIVNAVRVYEYFGGRWLLPFWDREWIDLWYGVPYVMRKKQDLYNKFMFENYFNPLEIGFIKPSFDSNYPAQWKEQLKPVLPGGVVQAVRRFQQHFKSVDPNNDQFLNELLKGAIQEPKNDLSDEVNVNHAYYFLQNLTN